MRIDAINQHHFPWTVKKHKLHLKYVVFIYLGKDPATKSEGFLEKFQTAFEPPPPPHFWKIILQFFIMDMVAFMQGGIGQIVSVNIS